MATWALVFFLFGGYSGNSPATGVVPNFDSRMLCERAAAAIKSDNWYCVQTSGGPAVEPPIR